MTRFKVHSSNMAGHTNFSDFWVATMPSYDSFLRLRVASTTSIHTEIHTVQRSARSGPPWTSGPSDSYRMDVATTPSNWTMSERDSPVANPNLVPIPTPHIPLASPFEAYCLSPCVPADSDNLPRIMNQPSVMATFGYKHPEMTRELAVDWIQDSQKVTRSFPFCGMYD